MSENEIVRVRPWQAESVCDAPECGAHVEYAIVFRYARPIDTLYLCYAHMRETVANYDAAGVSAS